MNDQWNGNDASNGTKAVLYSRVSSKEQEQGGFSIPAQQKLLRSYAQAEGLTVSREFTDAETAKHSGPGSGRPEQW